MAQDLLLIGAANKDREGKDKEGRQRQRRQKNKLVYSEIFVSYNDRQAVTVQRISQKYIKSALWTVTVPVSVQPCLNDVLLPGTVSMSESHFFRIIPLFESYHDRTVERSDISLLAVDL